MTKESGYRNFLIHDIILPLSVYVFGILIFIIFLIVNIDAWKIIGIINNGRYDLSSLEGKFPYVIVNILAFIVMMVACYFIVRKCNKQKEFHSNGAGYLNWPFLILTVVGRFLGYESIDTVNVPIWLQFKIYKSPWWQTKGLDRVNIECDTDEIICNFKRVKHSDGIVNVILVDTYDVKVPVSILKKHDTLMVKRKTVNQGNRTFNKTFVGKSITEINRLYKLQYNSMNLFCSTNPFHTKEIVKGTFRMDGREHHMAVTVFQSVGEKHIYSEAHQVIK
ncbi:hypothetical protein [Lactiplantibacillus plantarum]|uniref:hypothetical protein n=1 Tax=Lactiplantibacillus plantarum TaxID=1590 RepID=UPI002412FE8D|nr:hypothetical protein [Lactiplantibacillus plantarum]